MRPSDAVAICVPVRNERRMLPLLLHAIGAQRGIASAMVTLCCHFDACDDGSEPLALDLAARLGIGLNISRSDGRGAPNAGRARRAAMALGCAALGEGSGILLTTDADSTPRPDWVETARGSLATCDMVAGRIIRDQDASDGAQSRLEAYYDRLYAYRRTIDPLPWEVGPGHHFTGGANLGFRLRAYRALGGFRELASGEDAVIVDDAARAGLKVRRDPDLVVHTSARRDGRAPDGLAAALRHLDDGGATRVGRPEAAAWQYQRHARARADFPRLANSSVTAMLSARLSLTPNHILGVARDCPNAEAFAMRIVPAAPGGERLVPLAEAEQALALLERRLRDVAA